ncbi:metallophosphoesterase [Wenxinia saemankumensis]|uniref:Serine/threonine protein phosphatase 1 n=1 Tax=Wenxinia saemankumensis TaxID=1447782 RepID=A0A1M6G0L6_9RHOB|nr:metallophosphoesterase [Wenxinia saemankumensis]SHJ03466.1 serine/threonine protein phosphatase 1 [Wenxinia saemankumensis]
MSIYAIGDIHGQSAMLDEALDRIERDGGRDARIVFLGDYTDRGPDSRGVLDRLSTGLAEGRNWAPIKGNHDRMFERFLDSGQVHDARIASGKGWLHPALGGQRTLGSYGEVFLHPDNGGRDTLLSYEVDLSDADRSDDIAAAAREAVPRAHLRFLRDLPLMHREDGLLFVHAGLRPGVPVEEQDEEDLLWIREGFLEEDHDFGPLVVHGHTALHYPQAYRTRVNLDGGAGYGRELVPAVFEDGAAWLLTRVGRQALVP